MSLYFGSNDQTVIFVEPCSAASINEAMPIPSENQPMHPELSKASSAKNHASRNLNHVGRRNQVAERKCPASASCRVGT